MALAVFSLFAACKKDDTTSNNGNNNPTTPTYFIKAKIDGTLYEGTSFSANNLNNSASFSGMINYKGSQMALVVSQMDYTGSKTYNDTLKSVIALGGGGENSYTNWYGNNPVTIKVTSDDGTEVKAEFSGKLYKFEDSTSSMNITDGTLYLKWLK
jgi:hypothetical protein